MKRPYILVLSCICALALALFALSACGGSSSDSSSSSAAATSSSASASLSDDPENASASDFSEDQIKLVFEQLLMSMSEFYKGTTPVGEQIYYAGGADGENAIMVLIVPEANQSIMFVGPATVGEDNRLTVTDETTGSSITFNVIGNGDDTFSFSMNAESGAAVMTRCSSGEIVDTLARIVTESAAAATPTEGDTTSGSSETGQDDQVTEGTQ